MTRSQGILYAVGMAILLVAPPEVHPEDPANAAVKADSQPAQGYICLGIEMRSNGYNGNQFCPKDTALYGIDDPGGKGAKKSSNGEDVVVLSGSCCRMPFDDVLTDKHHYGVLNTCPENSVITSFTDIACRDFCAVRCTEINTEKYKLGPDVPGALWGGNAQFYGGIFRGADISFDDIPAAIRYSFGRLSEVAWDPDGCVGQPPGSLIAGKRGRKCKDFQFRQLLYRDGTPVVMFPQCSKISNPEDPNAYCIP